MTRSSANQAPVMTKTAPDTARNKKLPAPLGSQESSVPVTFTGTVMANSIAFENQTQSIIFLAGGNAGLRDWISRQ
jgi:hypothetical protein